MSNRWFWIFIVVMSMSGIAVAAPSDEKEWLACTDNDQCTTVNIICGYQPVNKMYADAMKKKYDEACYMRISDARPSSSCVNKVCVMDPNSDARTTAGK